MSTTLTNSSVYVPGGDITAEATSAVTERTFVAISGDRTANGNISVAPATAAGRICGVAGNTAASGGLVTVVRGNSRVVQVTAGGAITAGAEVEVGSAAKAVVKASGIAVGYVISTVSSGGIAEVSLY